MMIKRIVDKEKRSKKDFDKSKEIVSKLTKFYSCKWKKKFDFFSAQTEAKLALFILFPVWGLMVFPKKEEKGKTCWYGHNFF